MNYQSGNALWQYASANLFTTSHLIELSVWQCSLGIRKRKLVQKCCIHVHYLIIWGFSVAWGFLGWDEKQLVTGKTHAIRQFLESETLKKRQWTPLTILQYITWFEGKPCYICFTILHTYSIAGTKYYLEQGEYDDCKIKCTMISLFMCWIWPRPCKISNGSLNSGYRLLRNV